MIVHLPADLIMKLIWLTVGTLIFFLSWLIYGVWKLISGSSSRPSRPDGSSRSSKPRKRDLR